ncbi:hypothetical protein [Salinibacterium sp. ZJ70]|uniref:hypothetical protein n=1 Tax=Salinibacterium sp. ZJ70 TaxID=2708084 RepID=UPI00141F8B35|nr:hypothetical protein [Salinibacterium sp. ZJ70]
MRCALVVAAVAVVLAVSGCTSGAAPGSGSPGPVDLVGFAADGVVVGQGGVIQVDGSPAELCLGGVMDSYPPQCAGGVPLVGWEWEAIEGWETASGVTWGDYAVWGEWDGEALAVTGAIMLALYDPMPYTSPLLDPANRGDTSEAELLRIQEDLQAQTPFPVLGSWTENGYLFASVIYDDGRLQSWFDESYGADRVATVGALQPVDVTE